MQIDGREYLPRHIDPVVERHLRAFGAIEVAGTMWSGKTWTSRAHASSLATLDDEGARELAALSSEVVLAGENPRVIDEWQEVPSLWDAVRRKVDESGERGLYILTGSSRPAKSKTSHTGSGRISRLRMWPMSLSESGDSTGSVSLAGLFRGEFEPGPVETDLELLARVAARGGWPDALALDDEAAALVPGQYIDALVSADDGKAPEGRGDLRRFLQSLARNVGSAVTIETLVKDMGYLTDGKVTETGRERVRKLLAYFGGRYVIDDLHGWDAPVKSPQRLRTKPRRDFADSSLVVSLLGMSAESLIGNFQVFGQVFEQMCLRDLRVYASAMVDAADEPLRYYRDADGLEVDAIIELRDGRWGAVEVKLGANKVGDAVGNLAALRRKVASNPAARNPDPSFMMALVGVADYKYQTPEGVYVVPITELTA